MGVSTPCSHKTCVAPALLPVRRLPYDPEAGAILPGLQTCKSSADALRAVHEEFGRWFGAESAGPHEAYAKIASEIWQLWLTRRDPGA
jgi:hypothetical protein